MFGAVSELGLVWTLADISMGLMAVVNVIALFMLRKVVLWLANDYKKQLKAGVTPEFDPSTNPEVEKTLPKGIWTK